MDSRYFQAMLRHAEALAGDPVEAATDAELLQRVAAGPDEAAVATLLRRYGSLVWAVCRRHLLDPADAADAFQAVWLALIRSARRIRSGAALGGWLHGAAVRVSLKLRRGAARRKQREERVAVAEAETSIGEAAWDSLLRAVHAEVDQLPESLRTAFVLCELQGLRQPDAAARLGWPLGTLSGRLSQARQLLLDRLTARGLAPAAAAGALGLSTTATPATVPHELIARVAEFVIPSTVIAPTILQLSSEVLVHTLHRFKLLAASLLFTGGLTISLGAGVLAQSTGTAPPAKATPSKATPPADPNAPTPSSTPKAKNTPPWVAPRTPTAPQPQTATGPSEGLTPPGPDAGSNPLGRGGRQSGEPWEYKFAFKPAKAEEVVRLLTIFGNQGWEFAGICTVDPADYTAIPKPQFLGNEIQGKELVIFKRSNVSSRDLRMMGGMGPSMGGGGMGGMASQWNTGMMPGPTSPVAPAGNSLPPASDATALPLPSRHPGPNTAPTGQPLPNITESPSSSHTQVTLPPGMSAETATAKLQELFGGRLKVSITGNNGIMLTGPMDDIRLASALLTHKQSAGLLNQLIRQTKATNPLWTLPPQNLPIPTESIPPTPSSNLPPTQPRQDTKLPPSRMIPPPPAQLDNIPTPAELRVITLKFVPASEAEQLLNQLFSSQDNFRVTAFGNSKLVISASEKIYQQIVALLKELDTDGSERQ